MKWKPWHNDMMGLMAGSMSARDAARYLGHTGQQGYYVEQKPEFQLEYERIRKLKEARLMKAVSQTAKEILQDSAPEAAKRLSDLLEFEDPNVQLKAANSILDRTGHGAIQKSQSLSIEIPASDLEAAISALRELKEIANGK